jgi:adenine-specific DNA-methyltransferase
MGESLMDEKYKKLKTLLMELFQLDQPDLDFGLYRVLHARSAEITQFLDNDLLPQVKASFAQYKPADKAVIEKELTQLIAGIEAAGMNPEDSPKVKELRTRLTDEAVDLDALEADVYDHLYSFFRRYYSEGDFLSKRVYKAGVYAIPYEGEEVKLHWANADQYYIKTSEYLRDYAFRLRPDDVTNPMHVHFRLVEVAEGEHGNVKEQAGKERRFKLATEDPIAVENGEMVVRFTYQADAAKQKALNESAEQTVLAIDDLPLVDWIRLLGASHDRGDGTTSNSTRLRVHLDRYTARNTFDYFIHKDLGGFLRRELDFYIKNEVMHLDDVESESAPRVEQYLSKIKVIRRIAGKIIEFLAQLEDFQKKLWLKKKFVVETSYCIRLGIIPETFYADIATSDAQRGEWVATCGIDEVHGDLTTPAYSVPLTADFLKAMPTLMVDSRYLDEGLSQRICDALKELDELTNGVAVHSENSLGLQLMTAKYRGVVNCIYIDPPYNTGSDGFAFRDSYQHSSWLTMMSERLQRSERYLAKPAATFVSLDDHEAANLVVALASGLRESKHVTNIIWQKVDSPNDNKVPLTPDHEYVLCFSTDPSLPQFHQHADDSILAAYRTDPETGILFRDRLLKKNGANSRRSDRPTMYFPILDPDGHDVYPLHDNGEEACWSLGKPAVERLVSTGDLVWKRRVVAGTQRWEPYTREFAPAQPTRPYPTIWEDVNTMRQAKAQLTALFGTSSLLQTVKPVELIERVQRMSGTPMMTTLDYFAGSGTTGHAVINLNRQDGGARRFILIEQGDHFDSVLLPRLKKIVYTPEWKDGKPARFATPEEGEHSPGIVKILRLESYEDALNNLDLHRTEQQQATLDLAPTNGSESLKEQYMLRYVLDVETRGSQSLLNVSSFIDPTAYKLKVKRSGSDESREVNVDLLETFNWLIGLTVDHIAAPRTVSASFKRDDDPDLPTDSLRRLLIEGELTEDASAPWWFRTVIGTTPDGLKTLIIWRKRPGGNSAVGVEQDNLVLNEWFTEQGYSSSDHDFDLVYVNGGNNLEMLKSSTDKWTARIIEDDFHRLMFESDET